jgi:hypothetical protein
MAHEITIFKAGKSLLKVVKGEYFPSKYSRPKTKTPDHELNPDQEYGKRFSKGEDVHRNLKSVDITEKDFNIGKKMADKIYGKDHCKRTACNIILPKKYVDKVET